MYILSLNFDAIACTALLQTTSDPDAASTTNIYRFDGVGSFSVSRYHDVADSITLGDFVGVEISQVNENRATYSIDTGDATITFDASPMSDTNNDDSAPKNSPDDQHKHCIFHPKP